MRAASNLLRISSLGSSPIELALLPAILQFCIHYNSCTVCTGVNLHIDKPAVGVTNYVFPVLLGTDLTSVLLWCGCYSIAACL